MLRAPGTGVPPPRPWQGSLPPTSSERRAAGHVGAREQTPGSYDGELESHRGKDLYLPYSATSYDQQ